MMNKADKKDLRFMSWSPTHRKNKNLNKRREGVFENIIIS